MEREECPWPAWRGRGGRASIAPELSAAADDAACRPLTRCRLLPARCSCVHYNSPIGLARDGTQNAILQLPPSKTGAHGVISVRTLQASTAAALAV